MAQGDETWVRPSYLPDIAWPVSTPVVGAGLPPVLWPAVSVLPRNFGSPHFGRTLHMRAQREEPLHLVVLTTDMLSEFEDVNVARTMTLLGVVLQSFREHRA